MFAALREPTYRWFALGQFVSLVGSWMQRIAQDWLVLQLSGGNPVALGIASGLQFGPALLAPLGGVVADRCDRRLVLVGTSVVMGTSSTALGLIALHGQTTLGLVYALCAVLGLSTAVEGPVRHALVRELVPRSGVTNAVALNSMMFSLARIIGPALAGLLIGGCGGGWAFLANGFSFLAVVAALIRNRPNRRWQAPDRTGSTRVSGYLRGRPDLVLVLVLVCWMSTLALNFSITLPVMVRAVFHDGAGTYGLLTAALACGAVLGAAIAANRSARPSVRRLLVLIAAFGVVEILVGLAPDCLCTVVTLVPAGLLTVYVTTSANAFVQQSTTPELSGRMMGLYTLALLGGAPVGGPLMGALADWWGPRAPIVTGGGCALFAAIACAVVFRRWRDR
jgi:MFS family permease